MDFVAVVDQVIALLRQRGRVTYSTIKRQFQLDEAALEDVKNELIAGQRLAVDEQGNVLVWTGGGGAALASSASAGQGEQYPAPPADLAAQAAPPALAPSLPEAERRQLTVLFCDVVDSTRLSSQLDPEEYRDVVRAYQRVCTDVIQRYDGHLAQLLGDGLLVYFGYPQAHEDDAHRAVRTGLSILDAMGDLNQSLPQAKGIRLAVRVGIHTGLVVVGEMGGAGRQEQLALGEVPNVCARIEALAAHNTVAISAATYRLVQGYVECQELGEQTLRGIEQPLAVYRVLDESGAQSRLDIASTRGLTPLVGREQEVGLLLERWAQVKAGHGHVVLLTGEAGIGKSRLVQVLKDHVAQEPHVRWECRSAEYAQNTALFPLVDLFQRVLQWQPEESAETKLGTLERALSQYRLPLEESVQLFAPLLSVPMPEHHYPPLNLSPQRMRQRTLETLVAILLGQAEPHPLLFILEDLHWTDPTTLELLNLLINQTPTASLLVLLTCRPSFHPAWHHRSYITEMTLNHLSHPQVEQIVTGMTDGKTFPAAVLQQIIAKTDGVPLFVEEITKAILESGQLTAVDGHYAFTGSFATFAIPATLHDSLMARLDRLVTAKGIAQMGATIGRQFTYDLLQAVSQESEARLQQELSRLVEAEIVYQRGLPPQSTYVFKHALIQDAAYESLLKSTRQQYHQRIATVLETQLPAMTEAQPELVAYHCTEAGLMAQAVDYWYKAGQRAIQRSAHVEAIRHLTTGLELLKTLPETPQRLQREVDLHIALGASLIASKGYAAPAVEQMYTHARLLCAQLENLHQRFPILRGLWNYYLVRAELQTAHALGEQLLALAQQAQDAAMLVAAHRALGATLFQQGAATAARTHLLQGIAIYDPQQHRAAAFLYGDDAGVVCHSFAAWTLWLLGYPDQGLARNQEAVTLAQQSAHPFSLSFVLSFAAVFHQLRREVRFTQERAEAAIRLAQERGFPDWVGFGSILYGWAQAHQGQAKQGIEQLHQGFRAHGAAGARILRPYWLTLLAEAHGILGELEAGLTVLTEAWTLMDTTGERVWEPELYRLKGALLLQLSADHATEAESSFQKALEIAHDQQVKSFELRAASSLARLWQQQGKRAAARELLAPVYGWFTEGFDTADLQEAKALLAELSR